MFKKLLRILTGKSANVSQHYKLHYVLWMKSVATVSKGGGALRMVNWWCCRPNRLVITGLQVDETVMGNIWCWCKGSVFYIGIILFCLSSLSSPQTLLLLPLQSPVESISLLSSSLIGQSSGGDAPLMSLPTLMTKPVGQYLDLTLL